MIKYSQNSINILTTIQFKGIGKAWIVSNWRKDIQDEEIVDMINKSIKGEKISVYDFNHIRNNLIQRIASQETSLDGIVSWLDDNYPFCRGNIKKVNILLCYSIKVILISLHHNIAMSQ